MIEIREVIIGAVIGTLIIVGVYAALYGPDYIREISYPAKERVKFISINGYSFKDWTLRLDEENINSAHVATIKTPLFAARTSLQNLKLTGAGQTKRLFGEFQSLEPPFEVFGKFDATIPEEGESQIKVELLSAKVVLENLSMNRMSGDFTLIEQRRNGRIDGNLQIGSMVYGGMRFSATKVRLKGDTESIGTEINTAPAGDSETTLEMLAKFDRQRLETMEGKIIIPSPGSFANTLSLMARGVSLPEIPPLFNISEPIELMFTQTPSANAMINRQFRLKSKELGPAFQAIAELSEQENRIRLLARLGTDIPSFFPFGLKKTSGKMTSDGALTLIFNQSDDEVLGPFRTKLEGVTLENKDLRLTNLNGTIEYKTLIPLKISPTLLEAAMLSPPFAQPVQNVELSIAPAEGGGWSFEKIQASWRGRTADIKIDEGDQERPLPSFTLQYDADSIYDISHILLFDFDFSTPVRMSQKWRPNADGLYESGPLSITNLAPGLLTLNESIPELSNINTKNLKIVLESPEYAVLTANGTNPELYGDRPVEINTRIERLLAE